MPINATAAIIWALFYLEHRAANDARINQGQPEEEILKRILARVHEAMKDAGLRLGFDEDGNELGAQKK